MKNTDLFPQGGDWDLPDRLFTLVFSWDQDVGQRIMIYILAISGEHIPRHRTTFEGMYVN
jgi:hypothetical protein